MILWRNIYMHSGSSLDALLGAYAGGHLALPLHVLVQSHLEMQPTSKPFVAALEESVACNIAAIEAEPFAQEERQKRLDTVFTSLSLKPSAADKGSDLPLALQQFIGKDLSDIKWRWRMPGLKQYNIEAGEGYEASLLWIKAGRKMPSHTHDGGETTLVLKGSFHDINGRFNRGDVAIADADVDHSPRAGEGEDCICFVVTDAPLRLTGGIHRFFHKIMRH
jgi:putative transcriptional regulator